MIQEMLYQDFHIIFPKKILINYKNPYVHGTMLAKKDAIELVGNYDEEFIYSQDYKLVHDMIKADLKIKIIKKPLYELNMFNNISTRKKEDQEYFPKLVRKKGNEMLKIYINKANESWVVDRFRKEFISHNPQITTKFSSRSNRSLDNITMDLEKIVYKNFK